MAGAGLPAAVLRQTFSQPDEFARMSALHAPACNKWIQRPIMEELSALTELLLTLLAQPHIGVLFGFLIGAAVIDTRTRKIPNWLTASGAVTGVAFAIALPFSQQGGVESALGGMALGLMLPLPLYAFGVMGAGDVKLFAMTGAFLGTSDIALAVLCSFIVGGAAALGFALVHGVFLRMMANIKNVAQLSLFAVMGSMRPQAHIDAAASVGKMPYGVSICVGTIGYIVASHLGYL